MKAIAVLLVGLVGAGTFAVEAFPPLRVNSVRPAQKQYINIEKFASSKPQDENECSSTVNDLLDAVESKETGSSSTMPRSSANELSSLFRDLEEAYRTEGSGDSDNGLFKNLLGLYDVTYVQTEKEGDNPVGGKWTRKGGVAQKILSTRRAFQHLLPTNSTGCGRTVIEDSHGDENVGGRAVVAEAVNVISLDALFGLVRLTVMLRGDAVAITPEERKRCEERQAKRINDARKEQSAPAEAVTPLSARTVRAYFDAPRIVFGRKGRIVNLNVGPVSDVVLDTTYCDDKIRIGKGGNSGTRFLFKRCNSDDPEANEWEVLFARRPLRKWKALWALGTVAGFGFRSVIRAGGLIGRVFGLLASVLATGAGATILFSAGGIERDDFAAT